MNGVATEGLFLRDLKKIMKTKRRMQPMPKLIVTWRAEDRRNEKKRSES
jgi:hypothetical protein